ncbi:MAG: arylmalonate decarboxylase [Chromatiales bacterium]|jgi:maleate isomerase|nr:arylmalonate decarboxylase [Chromatiales bacterium]
MSKDALGGRCKFAIVAPSTNTIVQPDMEALRPDGVTNHFGRIHVPNMPIHGDEDFIKLVEVIGGELYNAVDRCKTMQPDYLIMGMSALMFWDGRDASNARMRALADHAEVEVSAGSFACEAALNLAGAKRIAVISPYQPISDKHVTRFFEDCGFDVAKFTGLRCESPVAIAEVPADILRTHVLSMNDDSIDAIVQIGTNLSMTAMALQLQDELGKPVVAINTATYWHALRAVGITDQVVGHGPLLQYH